MRIIRGLVAVAAVPMAFLAASMVLSVSCDPCSLILLRLTRRAEFVPWRECGGDPMTSLTLCRDGILLTMVAGL